MEPATTATAWRKAETPLLNRAIPLVAKPFNFFRPPEFVLVVEGTLLKNWSELTFLAFRRVA